MLLQHRTGKVLREACHRGRLNAFDAAVRIEPLEHRLLLHSNPVLDAEHAAVFALVPDSALTYKSVNSGNWSDANNWSHLVAGTWVSDGTLPNNGANVLISVDTAIMVDGDESK